MNRRICGGAPPLHARFGGDEFCFFLSDFGDPVIAFTVAERFWQAVAHHDWSTDDRRLSTKSVNVDIGMVCLRLGALSGRQANARAIAEELFSRADTRLLRSQTRNRDTCLGRIRADPGRAPYRDRPYHDTAS